MGPRIQPSRADPRFKPLYRCMNFPQQEPQDHDPALQSGSSRHWVFGLQKWGQGLPLRTPLMSDLFPEVAGFDDASRLWKAAETDNS